MSFDVFYVLNRHLGVPYVSRTGNLNSKVNFYSFLSLYSTYKKNYLNYLFSLNLLETFAIKFGIRLKFLLFFSGFFSKC